MNTNEGLCRVIYAGDAYKGMKNWKYKDEESTYYNYGRDMQSYIEISDRRKIRQELSE